MKKILLFGTIAVLIGFLYPSSLGAQEKSPKGYIEMPLAKDGSYIFSGRPGDKRRWGKPECIKALMLVAREWNRWYKGKYKIRIGDISNPTGSHFPPHKTHKDGLRVDITTSPNICHISWKDQKITLELAKLFVRFGAWRIFYNDPYVIRNVSEMSKLVQHDDHFHVEFKLSKIPKGEGPFVIADSSLGENAWVGTENAKKSGENWTGVKVGWAYLGANAAWQKAYQFELSDDSGTRLFATEKKSSRNLFHKLDYPLEHAKHYRWKVTVWGKGEQSLSTGFIAFRTDFTPPQVEGISPEEGAETDSFPQFKWKYKDEDSKQDSFMIELDKDSSHSRVSWRSDRQWSDKGSYTLPMELPRRTFYWRVRVWDGRGNQAASSWVKFKVKTRKKFKLIPATVTSKTLNLRKGPGTGYGTIARLGKGQKVYIVREHDPWVFVRLQMGSRIKEGFVHKDYLKKD